MTNKLIINTDGGARGNPGPAGIGVVLKNEKGDIVKEISEYIGETTNNQAEYKAVVVALEHALEQLHEQSKQYELEFLLDSELVVKQVNREYKVKNKDLAPLFVKIHNLSQSFKKVTFKYVRREFNKEADKLVNLAIDKFEI